MYFPRYFYLNTFFLLFNLLTTQFIQAIFQKVDNLSNYKFPNGFSLDHLPIDATTICVIENSHNPLRFMYNDVVYSFPNTLTSNNREPEIILCNFGTVISNNPVPLAYLDVHKMYIGDYYSYHHTANANINKTLYKFSPDGWLDFTVPSFTTSYDDRSIYKQIYGIVPSEIMNDMIKTISDRYNENIPKLHYKIYNEAFQFSQESDSFVLHGTSDNKYKLTGIAFLKDINNASNQLLWDDKEKFFYFRTFTVSEISSFNRSILSETLTKKDYTQITPPLKVTKAVKTEIVKRDINPNNISYSPVPNNELIFIDSQTVLDNKSNQYKIVSSHGKKTFTIKSRETFQMDKNKPFELTFFNESSSKNIMKRSYIEPSELAGQQLFIPIKNKKNLSLLSFTLDQIHLKPSKVNTFEFYYKDHANRPIYIANSPIYRKADDESFELVGYTSLDFTPILEVFTNSNQQARLITVDYIDSKSNNVINKIILSSALKN